MNIVKFNFDSRNLMNVLKLLQFF